MSQATISNWEVGKGTPAKQYLPKLESILGAGWLLPQRELGVTDGTSIVGAWLSRARQESRLTVPEVAQKAGVSVPTIYNIESGKAQSPHRRTIERLAKALDKPFESDSERELRQESHIEDLGDLIDFDPHDAKQWPNEPGVYVFYDISQRPIYIGQGKDISSRIKAHKRDKFWFREPIVTAGSYVAIRRSRLRRQVEAVLIKFLKNNAVINKQQVDR